MSETLRWWFTLTAIGILMLPLCLAMLRRLPDRGYTLSKPFGLLVLGYVFWLLNSFQILPNSATGIVLALLPLLALSAWFAYRERDELQQWLRDHWQFIAGVEALFFIAFVTAVWLRSTVGDIAGTEQPMDLMFLNSTMQADSFPPKDPWLSGYTVAYYYFGYLLVGMLAQLTSVPGDVAYNIGLGMIASMAFVGGAGIVYNLVAMRESAIAGDGGAPRQQRPVQQQQPKPPKPPRQSRRKVADGEAGALKPGSVSMGGFNWRPPVFGILGGLMLVAMGNLVYVLVFASAYGIGGEGFYSWLAIDGLSANEPRFGQWYPAESFQFFGSTRIFSLDDAGFYVITEFPMFSFILGDLHPHLMALPFVLVVVGLALSLFRSPEPLDVTFWLERPLLLLVSGVTLGGLIFINTWDVATMSIVILAAVFVSNFTRVHRITGDLFIQVATFAIPLVLLSFLFYLPFALSISGNSQVDGIGAIVTNDGLTRAGTRPEHMFIFWAPLLVIVMPFVLARLLPMRQRITRDMALVSIAPAIIVLVSWVLVFFIQKAGVLGFLFPEDNLREGAGSIINQITDRGTDWITFVVIAACLAAAVLALCLELTANDDRDEREPALFALVLTAVALFLILGCEFFFVGDVFTSRMNTVFKLYYQAWLLLAMAGGFSLYYLASTWRVAFPEARPLRIAWAAAAILVLAGAALYPIAASLNRARPYNEGGQIVIGGSLHGIGNKDPDELAAIAWLNERAKGQDFVIAEAWDNDYSEGGRISMATGLPTILGWIGHENQWRDGACKPCEGRQQAVETIYTSTDPNITRQILDQYGVTYVYVGPLEMSKYPAMADFSQILGQPVFNSGLVTIYRAQ